MAKVTIRIVWTNRAEKDLQKAYQFNSKVLGEGKSWRIVSDLYSRVESVLGKAYLPKVADNQFSHLNHRYFKIFHGHYKVTFRLEGQVRYVMRVFDMRQHPDRNL